MTTESAPLPPAGWYPSPDGSGAQAWWDGTQWVLNPEPAPLPVPVPVPAGAVPTRLAVATQILLGFCAAVSLAIIGVEIFGIGVATRYLGGDLSVVRQLTTYDQLTAVVSVLSSVSLIATGVVWVVWQFRAAKRVPGLTRRSPGWHAGSWFIPVISLVFPYQNVSDLWKAIGRPRPAWLGLWWGLWIASTIAVQISTRVYLVAEDLEVFLIAMGASLVGQLLLLGAAPLAWLIVRGITRGLVQSAQGSPQGASLHSQA